MNIIYNKQINKGKKIVLSLIIINDIYYLINFILGFKIENTQILQKQIFSILAIIVISFLFYKGFKFGAWFTYIFLINPVLNLIFYPLHLIGILELYDGWLFLVVTILIAIIGGSLIGNATSIDVFMKYQRCNRKLFKKTY